MLGEGGENERLDIIVFVVDDGVDCVVALFFRGRHNDLIYSTLQSSRCRATS